MKDVVIIARVAKQYLTAATLPQCWFRVRAQAKPRNPGFVIVTAGVILSPDTPLKEELKSNRIKRPQVDPGLSSKIEQATKSTIIAAKNQAEALGALFTLSYAEAANDLERHWSKLYSGNFSTEYVNFFSFQAKFANGQKRPVLTLARQYEDLTKEFSGFMTIKLDKEGF